MNHTYNGLFIVAYACSILYSTPRYHGLDTATCSHVPLMLNSARLPGPEIWYCLGLMRVVIGGLHLDHAALMYVPDSRSWLNSQGGAEPQL